jgi:choline dehydrogenase
VNQKLGRRWSTARGFLRPAMNRPNLTIITDAVASRVTFDDRRASGLVVRQNGEMRTLTARREVILATGAVATPALLERSGIGDGERLKALGVAVVRHAPGVGENLQDHLQLRPIFKVANVPTLNMRYRSLIRRGMMGVEYVLSRRGPLTMAPSQLGAFTRTSDAFETANIQMHIQPLSLDKFGDAMHPFPAITTSVCNLRPTSRGSVHARSPEDETAPVIQPNYLSTEQDRQVAAGSIRVVRRIMAQPAMRRYQPQEYRPGSEVESDSDLMRAAGDIGTTIFHPVGTARMGADSDPDAVVDGRLRVRGIAGLRVADASVMPTIVSGNTNSPTIMIAEKASAMILEDALGTQVRFEERG